MISDSEGVTGGSRCRVLRIHDLFSLNLANTAGVGDTVYPSRSTSSPICITTFAESPIKTLSDFRNTDSKDNLQVQVYERY